ncbi:HIT domain-containing protein [Candidatus Dependentiae bacterium]|nr:HIT domain-containing protein [Candidatus Dependentiae bacterium]
MQKTLFSKIIDREIPAQIVHEDSDVIVIKDINPVAPIHYLIIPKTVVKDMKDPGFDARMAAIMVKTVQYLAAQLPGDQAFNIIANNGVAAGQSVMHLHWHFISGRNIHENGFLR